MNDEQKIIQNVLNTLDKLKFKYNKTQEYLDFMHVTSRKDYKLPNGKIRNVYTVPIFMEYNPDFGETQLFTAYIDEEEVKVLFIGIDHGNLEVIYKDGKPTGTKFISPSFPYNKQ